MQRPFESLVGGDQIVTEIFGKSADRLLPPGDAQALAGAMLGFLENPERAETIAETIREHVRSQFRVSQMVDAVNAFYGEIRNVS